MPDSSLTDALKEAYAHATANPILDTIELTHPDYAGAARFVNNFESFTGYADATGSSTLTFQPLAFRFALPQNDDGGISRLEITLDNVSNELYPLLDAVTLSQEPLQITYRPYIVGTGTQRPARDPHIVFDIVDVRATVTSLTLSASFRDYNNLPFPNRFYALDEFPAL